jgi:N-dimethylarginine dimethylaminohydrolase
VRLPRQFTFEGEGDALWVGETLLFGFRFRSDAPTHEPLSRLLRRRVLPVELADTRFYHLDTCFCPIDATTALWFPSAFDRYGRTVIESVVNDLVEVSEADAKRFTCNAVVIGRDVVLQTGFSSMLRRQLLRRGLTPHPVDLSEFLKAGGSAKCLVLRLWR